MQDSGTSSDATFYSLSEEQTSAVGKIHMLFYSSALEIASTHNEVAKFWSEKSMPEQKFLKFKKLLRI